MERGMEIILCSLCSLLNINVVLMSLSSFFLSICQMSSMMRRINSDYIRAEHLPDPKRVVPEQHTPHAHTTTDVSIFFQKRIIELETKVEEMKATIDGLREEVKEKTALINLFLENERRVNETKEMNAILEELTLERTQKYVDLQSQLIAHLENYDSIVQ
jgi:uncharacterized coiled-coil protein SlyX